MNLETTARRPLAFAAAFIAAIAITVSAAMAFASPALADDDLDYNVVLKGVPHEGIYGINGMPGEKLTIKAVASYIDADNPWPGKKISGATYKWVKISSALKAQVDGNKLIIKKLPKAGKYKFRLIAYNKDGKRIWANTWTILVKNKISPKIVINAFGSNGPSAKSVSKFKKNTRIMMTLKNASFAWDNNKKKSFYTFTIKDLKTGKTAKYNPKTESFSKNAFFEDLPIGGASMPTFMGSFTKAGKYKITATVFRNDKKVEATNKTVTVK